MVKGPAIDIIIDLYSLPMDKFVYLCDNARIKYGPDGVDKLLIKEYNASPMSTSPYADTWIFAFNNREKYTEFYLKWM